MVRIISLHRSMKAKFDELYVFVALTIVTDDSGFGFFSWVVLLLLEKR